MLSMAQCVVGAGIGACASLPRAIAGDMFSGKELTKAISFMSMATALPSILTPAIGGFIQGYLNWRYNFLFSCCLALVSLIFIIFLPESHKPIQEKLSLSFIYGTYKDCIFKTEIVLYSTLSAIIYSSIILYQTMTPYLFQNILHISAVKNGFIFLASAVSYLLGNLVSFKMCNTYNEHNSIKNSILLATAGSIAFFLSQANDFLVAYISMAIFMINNFCCGVINPIIYKRVMEQSINAKGTSSCLLNMIRMILASLIGVVSLWIVKIYGFSLLPVIISLLWLILLLIHLKYINYPLWSNNETSRNF